MTDDDLRLVCVREIEAAEAHAATLSADRTKSLDYYNGKNLWASKPNESSVVTRETLETVEWMHPQLLKVFASSDDIVRFEPQGPEDEQAAEQATDFCNWIWNRDNNGFLNLHTWTKDALLSRVGTVKAWWEDEPKTRTERLGGLSVEQLTLLVQQPGIEITAAEESGAGPVGPDGQPSVLYDVAVSWTEPDGRVRIEPVPPEEYLFLPSCKTDADPGQGHKRAVTQSELLEMGYDFAVVDDLPTADEDDENAEKSHRFEPATLQEVNRDSRDRASRLVQITEWYTRADADGDGRAEFIKVTLAGNNHSKLLDREEVDCPPFAVLSPILMPHKLDGLSIPDLVKDLQEIKTSIMRQTLNSLYLANKPRHWILDQQVNVQDYLGTGAVRVKSPQAIGALDTQFVGAAAFPMLDYVDRVLEGRSGVSKMAQGIDADVLRGGGSSAAGTATGVAALQAAAAVRVELIARVFAETGIKRIFKLILRLITRYQQSERVIRLRNEWVPMDPRAWDADMDLVTEVGLGTGNKLEQRGYLTQILAGQKELLAQGGLGIVEPKHLYATYAKLTSLAGFKSVDPYFADPAANPPPAPPPPPPDPNMLAVQLQAQIEQAKLQLAAQKQQREDDRARDQMDIDFALKTAELQARYGAQINVAQVRAQVDRDREAMRQQTALLQQMNGQAQQPAPMPQQQGPMQ